MCPGSLPTGDPKECAPDQGIPKRSSKTGKAGNKLQTFCVQSFSGPISQSQNSMKSDPTDPLTTGNSGPTNKSPAFKSMGCLFVPLQLPRQWLSTNHLEDGIFRFLVFIKRKLPVPKVIFASPRPKQS